MYHYKLEDIRVIDGDTIETTIDLGCFVKIRRICRLRGIQAPEIKGPSRSEGLKTKARLKELISETDTVFGQTVLDKNEKYGRLLIVLFPGEKIDQLSFNAILEKEGLATAYEI
jgi:micrococcal nuclease